MTPAEMKPNPTLLRSFHKVVRDSKWQVSLFWDFVQFEGPITDRVQSVIRGERAAIREPISVAELLVVDFGSLEVVGSHVFPEKRSIRLNTSRSVVVL